MSRKILWATVLVTAFLAGCRAVGDSSNAPDLPEPYKTAFNIMPIVFADIRLADEAEPIRIAVDGDYHIEYFFCGRAWRADDPWVPAVPPTTQEYYVQFYEGQFLYLVLELLNDPRWILVEPADPSVINPERSWNGSETVWVKFEPDSALTNRYRKLAIYFFARSDDCDEAAGSGGILYEIDFSMPFANLQ